MQYIPELLLMSHPVVPKESCKSFHLCWNSDKRFFQIQRLLFVIIFFPWSEQRKEVNSLLSPFGEKKLHAWTKLPLSLHRKIQVVLEKNNHQRHLLFHQNCILLLYFQVFHLQVFLNLQILLLKHFQLVPNTFVKPSPSSGFGGKLGISYIFSSILSTTFFLVSFFFSC